MSYYLKRKIGRNVQIGVNVNVGRGTVIGDNSIIEDSVEIGDYVTIYPGAVIKEGAKIESYTIIGHPTKVEQRGFDFTKSNIETRLLVAERGPIVEKGVLIRSGSVIYRYVHIGENTVTGHNVVIREHTRIGERCVIGTGTILDGYIRVGRMSMIQSCCYVAQTVEIGEGCFIAPLCVFLDNKRIVLGEGLKGAKIGRYVRIGGGCKILPGIMIEDYAFIGAGSVVSRNIPQRALAFGNPAKVKRFLSESEVKEFIESMLKWRV